MQGFVTSVELGIQPSEQLTLEQTYAAVTWIGTLPRIQDISVQADRERRKVIVETLVEVVGADPGEANAYGITATMVGFRLAMDGDIEPLDILEG